MRRERAQRRERQGVSKIRIQDAERSGDKVLEATGLSFSYGENKVITSCSVLIHRGDKVALLGPNGSGKTTLLRLLMGRMQPDTGTVRLGSGLQVLYFDQMRAQIDSEATVLNNIAGGQEYVKMGKENIHVMTYLQNFLFDPKRALMKAGMLSGGERNRLLLAKLFSQPGNVLVMDEPTNDLDMETLELLEGLLVDFDGVVLVVSHDREFLDNVATSTLAIDPEGKVEEFVGGWSEWKRQDAERKIAKELQTPVFLSNSNSPPVTILKTRKLNFKETKELEALPARLEVLEAEHQALIASMGTAEFYRQEPANITAAQSRHEALEREMKETFTRWEELEGLAGK